MALILDRFIYLLSEGLFIALYITKTANMIISRVIIRTILFWRNRTKTFAHIGMLYFCLKHTQRTHTQPQEKI